MGNARSLDYTDYTSCALRLPLRGRNALAESKSPQNATNLPEETANACQVP